jgi:hypothetical protein
MLTAYEKAVKDNYDALVKEKNRYTAALRSDSTYSAASSIFNLYKNN